MSDESRGSILFHPRFLLFCLYVMAYLTLRAYGEIVHRPADMQIGGRIVREHIVGASLEMPRWRRQAYRAAFSPLMVAEEEGRRLKDKGRGLVEQVGDYGRNYLPN